MPTSDSDEVQQLRARLDSAQQLGGLGFWSAAGPDAPPALTAPAMALLGLAAGAAPAAVPALAAAFVAADRAAAAAALGRLCAAGEPLLLEGRIDDGAGGVRWLQLRGRRAAAADGARIEGSVQDIGERRATALALHAGETLLRETIARNVAVLAAVPDLWFVIGADGRYLEVSRPDHASLTVPWARMRGCLFAEVVPQPVALLADAALARARRSGQTERIEYRLRTLDGTERAFEARVVAMADGRWLYLTRDITEGLAAESALRDSEARYARAMRGTSDGLWDWGLASGQDHLSPRWKELLGFAPDELGDVEHSFFSRLHPEDAGPVRAALQAHFRYGAPYDIELRLRTKGGEWRWFRSRGEAERDADGQPLRMAGSIADITARKEIEDALRDSQARFSAMFATAPVGIGLSRLEDGLLLEANEELGRLLGWPAAEMVGRSTADNGIWTEPAQRTEMLEQVLREGRAALPLVVMRHRSGRQVHTKLSVQRLRLGGRELLLAAVTDISDRHAAEQALREQRESYAAIFDAASDAIVSVDQQGRVLIFNPGAERIFGRSADSMRGHPVDELLPAAQRERHHADIAGFAAAAVSRRAMGAGRVRGRHADGRAIDLEASISKAEVAGRPVLTAILRDVTGRVQAEAADLSHRLELSALTRQLMAQEQLTTQRLAQALHDQLGQTLTALRLVLDRDRRAQPLQEGEATQRREQAGSLVDIAVQQVRRVLVDLRPPLLEDEGLYAALDNELRTRAALHPQTDLLLDAAALAEHQRWPAEVEYALFMIAREAVDNAMRHAAAALVRVALAGDAVSARLEVEDDGVGMAPGADRARPGHLGLIGMRERARAIGGQLEIEAVPEGGTRLSVSWSAPA